MRPVQPLHSERVNILCIQRSSNLHLQEQLIENTPEGIDPPTAKLTPKGRYIMQSALQIRFAEQLIRVPNRAIHAERRTLTARQQALMQTVQPLHSERANILCSIPKLNRSADALEMPCMTMTRQRRNLTAVRYTLNCSASKMKTGGEHISHRLLNI